MYDACFLPRRPSPASTVDITLRRDDLFLPSSADPPARSIRTVVASHRRARVSLTVSRARDRRVDRSSVVSCALVRSSGRRASPNRASPSTREKAPSPPRGDVISSPIDHGVERRAQTTRRVPSRVVRGDSSLHVRLAVGARGVGGGERVRRRRRGARRGEDRPRGGSTEGRVVETMVTTHGTVWTTRGACGEENRRRT